MSTIEVKETAAGRIVRLSGELTIDSAAELKSAIMKAFEGCTGLKLDVSMVESVDLASVQVLCAAHRHGVSTGAGFSLSAPASRGFMDSLEAMALFPAACDSPFAQVCLWAREARHG
jgi:anti-anti-sigma factor